jgi:NAD(P)-dependent dehydrogenase (short-subunit alcohol dehydrogenase family)
MRGKVVVITGATSGIGAVAAERLATMGARVVVVARDRVRGEATHARLQELGPGLAHRVYYADLSLMAEAKRVGAEIAAAESRIDVLINNAGALFGKREITKEGLEFTFALNHMSYFVLTEALRGRLLGSAPARVINTSSEAHRRTKIDFDDLQFARGFGGMTAYQRSKLCNILLTRELSRRLAGTGVTANCLHPGFVNTRFGDETSGAWRSIFRIAKNFGISPEKGAETIVFLAAAKEIANVTGEYFFQCRLKTPSREAQDDSASRRLWEESTQICRRGL